MGEVAQRLAELEHTFSQQLTPMVIRFGWMVTALTDLLLKKGLIDRAELTVWIQKQNAVAEANVALEFAPEFEAFRQWRREREGRDVPPDDR